MNYKDIIYNSGLEWLPLKIEAPVDLIKEEIFKFTSNYVDQSKTGWSGLSFRGIDLHKVRPYTNYGFKCEDDVPYKWTELAENCPVTKDFICNTFKANKFYRIKVNSLQPGGKIFPHFDSRTQGLGLTEHSPYTDTNPFKLKYITIAVDWPNKTDYFVNKKKLPISEGDIFLVDFSKIHEVYNNSNKNRLSIIITADLEGNKDWESLVEKSYKEYIEKKDKLKKMDFLYNLKTRFSFYSHQIKHRFQN